MRILMFDIDTLRSDHLGCYGYARNTSPTIDAVAAEGVRFDNYYCPNAPCLPSRASLVTGKYGVRTGLVGHGGTAGDLRLQGPSRDFTDTCSENSLFMQIQKAGFHTVSFSTFPERHAAWWFNAGLNECINVGGRGGETAGKVTPRVLDWLQRNGSQDNWFLHVHYWDPHTPYRAPEEFGNPFEDQPLPDDWINQEIFEEHRLHIGPHGLNEINMWNDDESALYPRHPGKIEELSGVKNFIDQYDCGIRYTDDNIAMILNQLKEQGLYGEDLAIIITSDHGENIGELGIYAEHGTADEPTCHIPMIIKWPGCQKNAAVQGFYDNVDLLPTILELLRPSVSPKGPDCSYGDYYDGISYASVLKNGEQTPSGKDALVLTQCCHVCQRSARFEDWLYVRTIHGGYHLFPEEMLFNIKKDPHQTQNVAKEYPELCAKGAKIILDWTDGMLKKSSLCHENNACAVDPMWVVMAEGGPMHSRGVLSAYLERLKGTPREYGVELLKKMYPQDVR